MVRAISYSKRALQQIRATADYLAENFSGNAAKNLLDNIVGLEGRMQKYPESGRPTSHQSVRYVFVDDHRVLFYRFGRKTIRVLALFDTRQDPAKRPY